MHLIKKLLFYLLFVVVVVVVVFFVVFFFEFDIYIWDFCDPIIHDFLNFPSLSRHELFSLRHFLFYFNDFILLYDYKF